MTGNQSGRRAPGRPPSAGMTWVTGGRVLMGSEAFYPEERPMSADQLFNAIFNAGLVTNTRSVRSAGWRWTASGWTTTR